MQESEQTRALLITLFKFRKFISTTDQTDCTDFAAQSAAPLGWILRDCSDKAAIPCSVKNPFHPLNPWSFDANRRNPFHPLNPWSFDAKRTQGQVPVLQ